MVILGFASSSPDAVAAPKLASTAKIRSYIKDALLREENIRKEVKEYE